MIRLLRYGMDIHRSYTCKIAEINILQDVKTVIVILIYELFIAEGNLQTTPKHETNPPKQQSIDEGVFMLNNI